MKCANVSAMRAFLAGCYLRIISLTKLWLIILDEKNYDGLRTDWAGPLKQGSLHGLTIRSPQRRLAMGAK